jgi:hypothetical protein
MPRQKRDIRVVAPSLSDREVSTRGHSPPESVCTVPIRSPLEARRHQLFKFRPPRGPSEIAQKGHVSLVKKVALGLSRCCRTKYDKLPCMPPRNAGTMFAFAFVVDGLCCCQAKKWIGTLPAALGGIDTL